MASLEFIRLVPHNLISHDNSFRYEPVGLRPVVDGLPQIFWSDGKPWREANLWAFDRATSSDSSIKTITGNLNGLLNYARFLESQKLDWFHFPVRKSERCVVLYRGALIKLRESGELSPGTVSEYMRNCIMFYRWVRVKGLLNPRVSMWKERPFTTGYFDAFGFERTVNGITTDLKIPNRKRVGLTLEDGLLPVSQSDRDQILRFTSLNGTPELALMLAIGFFTGMRLGTICDLKVQTLTQAVHDPLAPGLLKLALGPGAKPAVHTKFSITGQVWMPSPLRDDLLNYAGSLRRLERVGKAPVKDRDLLFLTRFGNSYGRRGSDHSSAINVEMSILRKKALLADITCFKNFRFHQTRCTFGTELARVALLNCSDAALVVAVVSDALLHSRNSEATTFKYIQFVQTLPIKQALSNDFMAAFHGLDPNGWE